MAENPPETSTWKKDSQGKTWIWRKLSNNNSQKERKKASEAAKKHTYLNSYVCIRENNRTITSDLSEMKQGKDGRMKEKECKKYRKKQRKAAYKKSWELSNVGYYSVKRHQ